MTGPTVGSAIEPETATKVVKDGELARDARDVELGAEARVRLDHHVALDGKGLEAGAPHEGAHVDGDAEEVLGRWCCEG